MSADAIVILTILVVVFGLTILFKHIGFQKLKSDPVVLLLSLIFILLLTMVAVPVLFMSKAMVTVNGLIESFNQFFKLFY